MKKIKKIGAGLLLAVILTLGLTANSHKALAAATLADANACFDSMSFIDIAHIKCNTGSGTVTFTDANPTDSTLNYAAPAGVFCSSTSYIHVVGTSNLDLSDAGSTINAELNVGYVRTGSVGCTQFRPNPIAKQVANTGNIDILLKGGSSATSLDGVTGGSLSGHNYSYYNGGKNDPSSGTRLFGEGVDLTKCTGSILAVNSSGTGGIEYRIAGSGKSFDSFTNLGNMPATTGCGINRADFGLDNSSTPRGFTISPAVLASATTTPPGGSTDSSSDTSACVFKTNSAGWDTALSWILCPIVNGLSSAADLMNYSIKSQLNFDVNENLSGSVKKAWTVFRDLTSAALVVVMLIMVLSQAIGGGPFDAYTVRKLLPRLVAAIILMQVSWYLCIWLIGLANDAGQGIADLMAVPFGGTGALDLPSLLHRLSPTWAALISAGSAATVITAMVFSGAILAYGWPILLLAVILIVLSLVVELAILLFRNAFIVLLVMLSPLAFLAYVLPGTDRYWKYWKDNFTRLLIFFPLIMAIIYAGRIFAWTAANLGSAGGLDVIMVIAGFFGPYFILPRAFKWGGSLMATVGKELNEAWPVKKGRETAKRELLDAQRRNIDTYGKSKLNPMGDPNYFRYGDNRPGKYFKYNGLKRKWGIPYGINAESRLGHTVMTNALGGRFIPTRRSLGSALSRQDETSKKEDALEEAIAKRGRDKQTAADRDISAGKDMSLEMVRNGFQAAYDGRQNGKLFERLRGERTAKSGIRDLLRTSSFLELANMRITDPKDGEEKYIWETDFWRDTVAPDGELYGAVSRSRPDWKPHRLPTGLPKYRGELKPNYRESITNRVQVEGARKGWSAERIQAETQAEIRKTETIAAQRRNNPEIQWADALVDVVSEMDTRDLQGINPVMFDRIGKMAEQGVTYLNQADQIEATNPEEAARLRLVGNRMIQPAASLRGFVQRVVKSGNQFQLGPIIGGSETEGLVNYALKFTSPDLHIDRTGHGNNIQQIINADIPAKNNFPETDPDLGRESLNRSEGGNGNGNGGGNGNNGGETDHGGGGGNNGGGNGGGGNRGGGRSSGGGGGAATEPGLNTTPGRLTYQQPAQTQQPFRAAPAPLELKIDHEALGDTIREASRLGSREGVTQALRRSGLAAPGDTVEPQAIVSVLRISAWVSAR